MGAVTRALRDAAESFGATVRTDVDVDAHPRARRHASRGVVTRDRRGDPRRRRDRGDAPADHVPRPARPRPSCPTTSSTTIARWKTRSGTVKVNLAIDRLPEFTAAPGFDPEVHGGTIVLAPIARPRRERVPGRGRGPRRPRCRSPTSASRRCSTRRSRPRASTSCRCSRSGCRTTWATEPHRDELDAYADRVDRPGRRGRARASRDSILHRQVIGPYDMEHDVRPDRRQHLPRRAVARRSCSTCGPRPATPTSARRSADLYQASSRDPRRRRRHRHPRAQGRRADPPRPQGPARPPRPPPPRAARRSSGGPAYANAAAVRRWRRRRRRRVEARSISASVTTSGGMKRTTLP